MVTKKTLLLSVLILISLIVFVTIYYFWEAFITALVTVGATTLEATILGPTTTTVSPGVPSVPTETTLPTALPEYKITLNLSTDILHVMIGDKTSFVATVNNTGTEKVESIRLSIEWIPLKWISVSPSMSDISPGEKQDYLVMIDIPKDTETGLYELKVKATDDVESNTETLKLIIGRNYKEIADLLLIETEKVRIDANESLSVEDCLDITLIKTLFENAEIAYEKALEEHENENYEESINWLEYVIPTYEKVVNTVDIAIEIEIKASEKSLITISNLPSLFNLEKDFELARIYLNEKNYKEVCVPILRMRRLVMISLIFWPGIIILIITLVVVAFIIYRKKKKLEKIITLRKIKRTLRKI